MVLIQVWYSRILWRIKILAGHPPPRTLLARETCINWWCSSKRRAMSKKKTKSIDSSKRSKEWQTRLNGLRNSKSLRKMNKSSLAWKSWISKRWSRGRASTALRERQTSKLPWTFKRTAVKARKSLTETSIWGNKTCPAGFKRSIVRSFRSTQTK